MTIINIVTSIKHENVIPIATGVIQIVTNKDQIKKKIAEIKK